MIIIEKILGKIEDFETEGLITDKVLLDHYDMEKPHQKLKTESGMVLAVSLGSSHKLFSGAVIYKDKERLVVTELLPENVLVIRPVGNREWAKTAFNIGNMHHPAYLHDDCIVIPYDAIMESLLKGIGVAYTRCERQLTGERANHVVGGHSHSHGSHGHSHSHDHSHNHSSYAHGHHNHE